MSTNENTLSPAAEGAATRRRSRAVRALLDAGRRLVSDGGIDGATIDDIVRSADVSRRSFHNHYRDKDELVEQVLLDVRSELDALVAEANQGIDDTAVWLVRGLFVSFRYALENRLGQRVLLNIGPGAADPDNPRNQALVRSLRAGIEAGELKLANIDAGVVLTLALAQLGFVRLLQLRSERSQARDYMFRIGVLLLRGLGVDGRRIPHLVEQALVDLMDPWSAGLAQRARRPAR